MADYNVLKEYFVRYLREVRRSSDATVNHYLGALKTISKYLVEHEKLTESIYEISEITELETIRMYLYSQPDFVAKDERGNRMYSAGLNNYLKFAKGEEFPISENIIRQLDIEIPIGDKASVIVEQWRRNGIIKKQAIEMADYLCEMDSKHVTFTSATTKHQYMEGHHAIPIKQQSHFGVSLDVYANIVCVCPICHRLLHYGIKEEKENVLNRIYSRRADRLANSGIKLSKDEFMEFVI